MVVLYPTQGGQVKFWRLYFFDLQGAKHRRSQSYGEHFQRGSAKKERDKNHLPCPRGVIVLVCFCTTVVSVRRTSNNTCALC